MQTAGSASNPFFLVLWEINIREGYMVRMTNVTSGYYDLHGNYLLTEWTDAWKD